MKFITREITSYECTFGRFDLSTNSIVSRYTVTTTTKPGPKYIKDMEKSMGTLMDVKEVSETLCMPISLFTEQAKAWMSEHSERPSHMKNQPVDIEELEF